MLAVGALSLFGEKEKGQKRRWAYTRCEAIHYTNAHVGTLHGHVYDVRPAVMLGEYIRWAIVNTYKYIRVMVPTAAPGPVKCFCQTFVCRCVLDGHRKIRKPSAMGKKCHVMCTVSYRLKRRRRPSNTPHNDSSRA